MSAGSTKAVVSALVANGGIAISKTVAAAVTGSGSLLAESLHSWADCTNQVFLLMGMRQVSELRCVEVQDSPRRASVAMVTAMAG